MKNILEMLSNMFAKDKLLHFFYGSAMSFILFNFIDGKMVVLAIAVFAIAKELYDYKKTGFSFIDIVFTIMPSIMFLAIQNQ